MDVQFKFTWDKFLNPCLQLSDVLTLRETSSVPAHSQSFPSLITPVSPPRSGSAADTQAITDIVKYKLNFAEIEQVPLVTFTVTLLTPVVQGRPATVKDAAVAFKEICYEYR